MGRLIVRDENGMYHFQGTSGTPRTSSALWPAWESSDEYADLVDTEAGLYPGAV